MAHGLHLGDHPGQGAHHAVDLGLPGIGGDEDPHRPAAINLRADAFADPAHGRLARRQAIGLEASPEGAHQGVTGGKVAIDRALAHPRQPGDLGVGGFLQAPILQQATYSVEDPHLGLGLLLASGQAFWESPEWHHGKITATK